MSKKNRSNQKETTEKKDKSPYVYQENKLDFKLNIRERDDLTERQKVILETMTHKDTKCVLIKGPAGCTKSFLAILAMLRLLNDKKVSQAVYFRTAVECAAKSIGFLPSTYEAKIEPYMAVLADKLEELLPKPEINMLLKNEKIKGEIINFQRGLGYASSILILDESQLFTFGELITIITRLGMYSKVFILADPDQNDIGNKSGFNELYDLFNKNVEESAKNGIYSFELTSQDIKRSPFVKYVVELIKRYKKL
jgi:predicted ribonuclease YlaK